MTDNIKATEKKKQMTHNIIATERKTNNRRQYNSHRKKNK
jgi:hypothetical protein